MEFLLIGIIVILVILLLAKKKKENNELTEYQQQIEARKQQYENELKLHNAEKLNEYNSSLAAERDKIDENLESRRKSIINALIEYENQQRELLDKRLIDYKERIEQEKIAREQAYILLQQQAEEVFYEGLADFNRYRDDEIESYNKAISQKVEEINSVKNELKEWESKRTAINQEILRQREIEEKEDFYRIMLPEEEKKDISILNSIRSQLYKTDLLDKLIYDTYIAKPTNEMIKRVLKGEAPSGIYKITRLKTGEVYIGKSTDIKSRWQQHTKSAFHCGTISHSTLHTTMEKDGIDNFTFELLEQVSKDKLSEREKYWIDFYDSKKYGLNQKEGG